MNNRSESPEDALAVTLEAIADTAREGLAVGTGEALRDAARQVFEQVEGLRVLVDKPAKAAEADPGDGRQKRADGPAFDACRLVEAVAEAMAPALGERPVELVSLVADDVPRMVLGDARRVHRVLGELLDNAVRFTDAGMITVECGWSEGLVLQVTDTGPGIPPIHQPRIWESTASPHQPPPGIWQARAGAGLGLPLCRELVEGMGGEIVCRSRLGEGSTFEVRLPFDPGSSAERPLPGRIEGRVLLVEDHPRLRANLARAFEDLGFLVDDAADGREALHKVRHASARYAMALLDADLGDAPGEALIDLIGDRPPLREVPRVAMCRDPAGFDGPTVRKPVTRWRLERAVERALGRRLARRTVSDEPPTAGERRVLVVDDNADSRHLAARILGAYDYTVDLAEDGVEAVSMAGETAYDLIVMDVEMPRLDGLEASRRIRAAEYAGRRAPIIALTAHDSDDFRRRCIDAGMDEHVPRPISGAGLLQAVDRALGVASHRSADVRPLDPGIADPLDGPLPPITLDPELLDLLPAFVEHRRANVDELRRWLDGHEAEPAVLAHGLKGVGGAFGFPAITALGARLGEAIAADDRDVAARCIERLEAHVGDIAGAVAEAVRDGERSGSRR